MGLRFLRPAPPGHGRMKMGVLFFPSLFPFSDNLVFFIWISPGFPVSELQAHQSIATNPHWVHFFGMYHRDPDAAESFSFFLRFFSFESFLEPPFGFKFTDNFFPVGVLCCPPVFF